MVVKGARSLGALAVFAAGLQGCNVEPRNAGTGGVDLGDAAPAAGTREDAAALDASSRLEPPAPARGIAVVNTDYASSVVSLLSLDGTVTSASFIASSGRKPGLSAALSGDVVLPTPANPGNELVLVDRFPASVLTWVNLETAEVRAQLSVATGFASNPHDYVTYGAHKAYVPRFEPNLGAGKEPFDAGNDVLVIDPTGPAVTGSIDLMPALAGEPTGFYPRADRAVMAGGKLRVLCAGYKADFTGNVSSRIVTIDPATDEITQVLVFRDLNGCGTLSLSPDGARIAVACNGKFGQNPGSRFPDAGVVVLDVGDELVETGRFTSPAASLDAQIGAVAWTSRTTLLVTTYGRYDEDQVHVLANDTVRWLDAGTGAFDPEPLLETDKVPYSIGDVRCEVGVHACYVTDAERNVLQRFTIMNDGRVELGAPVRIDARLGLPPRYLGVF